jgi:hypothetical protein
MNNASACKNGKANSPAPGLGSNSQILGDPSQAEHHQNSAVSLAHPITPNEDPQRLLSNNANALIDPRLPNIPSTPRDGPMGPPGGLSSNLDFLADISAHQPRSEPDINPMMLEEQQTYFGWSDIACLNAATDQHQSSRPVGFDPVPNEMLQLWLEPRAESISHHSSQDFIRDPTLGLMGDPFLSPTDRRCNRSIGPIKSSDNIPNERFARVERCWLAPPNHVGRLMTSLWYEVSCFESGNLFSTPMYQGLSPLSDNVAGTRFGLDEDCRQQLQAAFGLTQVSLATLNSPSNNALSSTASTTASGSIPSFPPAEILDMALDLYFRHFHPLVPFIHMPTFSAKRTRLPLLFVMCQIGMVILGTKGTTSFVTKTFGVGGTVHPDWEAAADSL